ncbi:MAG: hypothetical protein LUD17_13630 [Bacteroidales bacterium]|nr:hypothetical protein [Bacteroidales bacterium]
MSEQDLQKYLDIKETKVKSPETLKIEACLRECQRKMLEQKARLGYDVVTEDANGVPCTQRAIDVYHRIFGPLPPLYPND